MKILNLFAFVFPLFIANVINAQVVLTPKTGMYKDDNNMAFLDGCILAYHPHDADHDDINGDIYFTYFLDSETVGSQMRLWMYGAKCKKIHVEFDVQTTTETDSNNFYYCTAQTTGGYGPWSKPYVIKGKKRDWVKFDFKVDNNGALMKFKATKGTRDVTPLILRSIKIDYLQ